MTTRRMKYRGHDVEVNQSGRIVKFDGKDVSRLNVSIYSTGQGYCPGGATTRSRRREAARYNGRRGGKALGRKRRQLAQQRRRTRDGGLRIPFAYKPVPRISHEKFEQKFRNAAELAGRRFNQAGCDTTWAMYVVLRRWYDVHGNGFEITTGNLEAALQASGRPRSRRTVEYVKVRLVELGLIRRAHVKRSGPRRVPGQMDTCRIWLRRGCLKNCTPPLRGRGKRSFVAQLPSAAQAESVFREPKPPKPPSPQVEPLPTERQAATPPGTEGEAAATPELTEPNHGARLDIPRRASDDEDFQRQLEFDELKRRMGWSVPLRVRRPEWGERASP